MHNILDISIFIISALGIILEMLQMPLFWLLYIIGSLLLGYEFTIDKLYGSSLLQGIYIILSIYGFYKWVHKDNYNNKTEDICHINAKQLRIYSITTILLTIICYFILKYTKDSTYLSDAILTAICITATYMAALKQIESWFIFAATVIISVPLYLSYHLYFTALTYLIFGILDTLGGIKWLMLLRSAQNITLEQS